MPEAIGAELGEYWPMEMELLAIIAELLDNLLLVTVKAHGGKTKRDPLQVPRPGRAVANAEQQETDQAIGMGSFVKAMHARG